MKENVTASRWGPYSACTTIDATIVPAKIYVSRLPQCRDQNMTDQMHQAWEKEGKKDAAPDTKIEPERC